MPQRPLHDLSHSIHRPKRAEKSALVEAQARLVVLGCAILLGFLLVGGRLVDIGISWVLHGVPLKSSHHATLSIRRATILDAQGEVLATNLKTASVFANPREILDMDEVIAELPKALPSLSAELLRKKLAPRDDGQLKSFVWLARNITPAQHAAVLKLGLPGIQFLVEEKRVYPQSTLAAHVIGFTDIDNHGLAGVERYFDQRLTTQSDPLKLSIDMRVQAVVEDELAKSVAKFHAVGGNAIIMDAKTGAIVAMAALPTFNPNYPTRINKDHLFNPMTLGIFDMGSIFKLFNVAMALDTDTVTLKSGYDATHPLKIGRFTIKDFLGGEQRWLSVPEIILYSSNIGSAKMALDAGADRQKEYLKRYGFFDKVPIELKERGSPMTPRTWSDATTITVSYGYGLAVSPLHVVRGFAALVNGGRLVTPSLMARPEAAALDEAPSIISEATSRKIRQLAYLVTSLGTGKKANVEGLFVGCKTGTAEKRHKNRSGFSSTSNLTSFLGAFPIYDPKYVVFVMLDEPQAVEGTYGFRSSGWNATPTAGAIIQRSAPLLGLRPAHKMDLRIRKMLEVPGLTPPLVPTAPFSAAPPLVPTAPFSAAPPPITHKA